MEPCEHHPGLGDHLPDGWYVRVLVKKNGIPFDFRNRHAQLVRINQDFEQFSHNVSAVPHFRFVHKLRKAADVGDKKQRSLVAHGVGEQWSGISFPERMSIVYHSRLSRRTGMRQICKGRMRRFVGRTTFGTTGILYLYGTNRYSLLRPGKQTTAQA